MRRVLVLLLVFLSVAALVLRFGNLMLNTIAGKSDHAGIRVEAGTEAQVTIDNRSAGQTPLQKEDLSPGEHLVVVSTGDTNWQGFVKLSSGTLTVVNRDLAASIASSSGEIITLEKGSGATVVSSPSSSDVAIDGQPAGKTPLSISSLSPGEHTFTVSHANYLARTIRATSTSGFNLTLAVDLAVSEADLTQVDSSPPIQSTPQVVVKQTPTGFLRVRTSPSTSSDEVTRVSSGDTLTLLEEQPNWDRIRTSDGKEGYVSTQYVEKKAQ